MLDGIQMSVSQHLYEVIAMHVGLTNKGVR